MLLPLQISFAEYTIKSIRQWLFKRMKTNALKALSELEPSLQPDSPQTQISLGGSHKPPAHKRHNLRQAGGCCRGLGK